MAKNTQTAKPFEPGESNARASRTPETDQVIDREAEQTERTAQQQQEQQARANETSADQASPKRKRATKGGRANGTTETGARKRTAGKHRK